MLTNIDEEGSYVDMGVGRIFFRRGHQGFFQNFSMGGQKWQSLLFPTRN